MLYGILAQGEDDELIARNPVRIRAGGRTKVQREPEVLTLNELFDLVDAMPEKHRALTLICGLGGLRFGEAVALRRRDVDIKLGIVRVVQNASRAAGQKQVGPPKTDAGRRDVALPAVALIWKGGLSRGQGEAASKTVAVDAASGCRSKTLVVTSVSVSTRRQSDIRGLVTAGRAVRLERTAV